MYYGLMMQWCPPGRALGAGCCAILPSWSPPLITNFTDASLIVVHLNSPIMGLSDVGLFQIQN